MDRFVNMDHGNSLPIAKRPRVGFGTPPKNQGRWDDMDDGCWLGWGSSKNSNNGLGSMGFCLETAMVEFRSEKCRMIFESFLSDLFGGLSDFFGG